MKQGVIIFLLAFTLIAIFSINQCSSAQDFKIEKVIEIGPAARGPIYQPLKWSPDGSRIAYFNNLDLMIWDTTGNTRTINTATFPPHSFEWFSDSMLIVHITNYNGARGSQNEIYTVNAYSGLTENLENFTRRLDPADTSGIIDFEGPKKTIEGGVYYSIYRKGGHLTKLMAPAGKYNKSAATSDNNHFLAWGKDGLYKINIDHRDSVRLGPKPYDNMPLPPVMSPDQKYIIDGGTMMRLKDSVYIVLDTILKEIPPKTAGCGYLLGSFNPNAPEFVFTRSCDDGHNYVVRSIGIFNYETGAFGLLDDLLSLTGCHSATYSPDGLNISLISNGKLYVAYRRAK
jgi:hypothetical protein